MKHIPALFIVLCALIVMAGCSLGTNSAQPALPTATLLPTEAVIVPTAVPTVEKPALPAPVSTGEGVYVPPATPIPPPPTPKPLWDLRSLVFNASVVADAMIIGSEKRPGSYTFIFYVHEWYKNEPGVKDNIVRLTLDTTRNWDKLVYLPRNLIGGDAGSSPFNFMLFLGGTPDNYFIVGDTAGMFYLGDRVETGAGAEEYQNMAVQSFKEELLAVLPATPTPLPPSPTPLPTPADGSPVSLLRVGDGYQVYVHRGIVRIGVGGAITWLGASRLRVDWSSGKEPYEGASYAVDAQAGTMEKYIYPRPEWDGKAPYGSAPNPDGKSALLVKGATEDIWAVTYYDTATKQEQTVYDRDPAVAQWAGADAHEPGVTLSPGTPIWLNEEMFVLPLGSSPATGEPRGKGKLLLVSASSHKVRLLAKSEGETDGEISYCLCGYGMPLVYQNGSRSGPLLMLLAPYTGKPITLTAGGPWIRDWTATADGRRVAWVEATAPPGDWSVRLPSPCVPCQDPGPADPEPQVQAIAIWDAATGQVYRYKPSNLVWSLGSTYFMQQASLYWRADGSALIYATHSSAGAPGRTALYSLTPGSQPELLAEHPWDGSIQVLSEGGEGSLYYYVTGRSYYSSGDLVRRHPDGRLEVLHENLISNMWWMEPGKWLEVLQEGGVAIHDFATGNTGYARFSGESPSPDQLGWGGVQNLVPVSPDGKWAAYAGTNSDMGVIGPGGKPDRGQEVQIVRVK
ncbi:MAG: hypothetical protein IVW55_16960 [Chloroflexi bacterium]|nr:hypothetical protein [Chloroflexota bacterium]